MYRITLLLPLPVAQVDGENVPYRDYLVQYRGSEYYLGKYGDIKLNTADGKRQLDYVKRQSLDKAEQMIQQAIILDPNNSSVEDTYAWVLFKQKKYNEARIWIEKAIQDNRVGSGTELEHCGDILYHLGEKQQALEQWRKAKAAGNKSYQLEKKINEQKYIE
jgi:Tfp pilus assembly protein PilF